MPGFVKKCPFVRQKIEEDVRVLDYRHSSLQDIPTEVFNRERTLEELYADSNQIRDLPRELFHCHGLRKLSISDNEITNIPPAISSLSNLEELDFSKNGIIDVPDNIKGCKYLRSVDASVNPLGKLPEGITHLSNLTYLYLNDTFLDFLPGSFGRMVTLKILELRENHLKTLPHSFSRLVQLERLDIGNNEFTELSDVIGGLNSLLELWCDNNQITTITHNVGNLKQLMFLDASNNHLQHLPTELQGCVSLADLHLTSNNLTELPDSIGNLNNLTTLKVDDNQLTSLPSTLGGLTSLSELNVSANNLEELPASIGLLRNLRTFYADENILGLVPAEMGSCSGITVLSLRGNKLTYIPDELCRIPRLRVLNLSDNLLNHLPFSIVKLKELQALWLAENQTRPLIPLQSEYDPDTGRKILTCYLLPQGQMKMSDDRVPVRDSESFHASMWDEERNRRQQIHFDFAYGSDEEGTLVRCPTPYPKEMREKVRHARNLALRQIMVGEGQGHNLAAVGVSGAMSSDALMASSLDEKAFGSYSDIPEHSDTRVREARIMKPTSPRLQETHRLYKFDKEKLFKDKVRMQHRLSMPDFSSDVRTVPKDSKFKDKKEEASLSRYSGSVPDLTADSKETKTASSGLATSGAAAYDDLYSKQIAYRHKGRRSRRLRDYDSETGYRSDGEIIRNPREAKTNSSRGASSDIFSVQSQPLPHHNYNTNYHQQRGRGGGRGYASDVEGYTGGNTFPTANAAAAAFQKQHPLSYHPAHSVPYNLDTAASHSATPVQNSSRNFLSYSSSKPHQYGGRRSSDIVSQHLRPGSNYMSQHFKSNNSSDRFSSNSSPNYDRTSNRYIPGSTSNAVSNDELYSSLPGNDYYSSPHQRLGSSCDTTLGNNYSSSQSQLGPSQSGPSKSLPSQSGPSQSEYQHSGHPMLGTSQSIPSQSGPSQQGHQHSGHPVSGSSFSNSRGSSFDNLMHSGSANPTLDPDSQKQTISGLPAQSNCWPGAPPLTTSRPNQYGQGERHVSLPHSHRSATPSPSVFPKDSFIDQNTPMLNQTLPSAPGVGASPNSASFKVQRSGNLYSVVEQRPAAQKFMPSPAVMSGQPAATPPPYTSTPPYRRPENRSPASHTSRLSSDTSSSCVDSPRSSTNTPAPMSGATTFGLPNLNLNRSETSPCGFHGSKPFSDLPTTPREKLTFSDYADIDHISQGRYHSDELSNSRNVGPYQYTSSSRSGSSSSHIGSASQIGQGSRRHDPSNSSDSRSDVHNYSSSRESPYSGIPSYASVQPSFKEDQPYDHYSGPFDSRNLEDVTRLPNQEQSSQVSSSTDSGYGPGHVVYDSIGDYSRVAVHGYSTIANFGSHGSEAKIDTGVISAPSSQRKMSGKSFEGISSRDITPIRDIVPAVNDFAIQEHTDQFHVTVHKNPGLGFSIAGGIGSHGNPYRENDIGIFVTKVIPDGPASKLLRPGDKLLQVNQVDFQAIEHKQAVATLKISSSVDLLVERVQKVNLV